MSGRGFAALAGAGIMGAGYIWTNFKVVSRERTLVEAAGDTRELVRGERVPESTQEEVTRRAHQLEALSAKFPGAVPSLEDALSGKAKGELSDAIVSLVDAQSRIPARVS